MFFQQHLWRIHTHGSITIDSRCCTWRAEECPGRIWPTDRSTSVRPASWRHLSAAVAAAASPQQTGAPSQVAPSAGRAALPTSTPGGAAAGATETQSAACGDRTPPADRAYRTHVERHSGVVSESDARPEGRIAADPWRALVFLGKTLLLIDRVFSDRTLKIVGPFYLVSVIRKFPWLLFTITCCAQYNTIDTSAVHYMKCSH